MVAVIYLPFWVFSFNLNSIYSIGSAYSLSQTLNNGSANAMCEWINRARIWTTNLASVSVCTHSHNENKEKNLFMSAYTYATILHSNAAF